MMRCPGSDIVQAYEMGEHWKIEEKMTPKPQPRTMNPRM